MDIKFVVLDADDKIRVEGRVFCPEMKKAVAV